MTRRYRPDGWPTVVPRIFVNRPALLVEFVRDVFGASGELQEERPCELRIGDSMLLISGTGEREPTPAFLYVYVPDTDLAFRRAVARGASVVEEPRDLPYGDRRAMVRDSWGNTWQIATRGGDLAP